MFCFQLNVLSVFLVPHILRFKQGGGGREVDFKDVIE